MDFQPSSGLDERGREGVGRIGAFDLEGRRVRWLAGVWSLAGMAVGWLRVGCPAD